MKDANASACAWVPPFHGSSPVSSRAERDSMACVNVTHSTLGTFVFQPVLGVMLRVGETLVSSRVIAKTVRISKCDAETYDLPRLVRAWRVSVIATAHGALFSRFEAVTTEYGYLGPGPVQAHFSEIRSHAADALARIAPTIDTAARVAWREACNGLARQSELF